MPQKILPYTFRQSIHIYSQFALIGQMLLVDPTQRPNINSIYGELSDLATTRNVPAFDPIIFNEDVRRKLRTRSSGTSHFILLSYWNPWFILCIELSLNFCVLRALKLFKKMFWKYHFRGLSSTWFSIDELLCYYLNIVSIRSSCSTISFLFSNVIR